MYQFEGVTVEISKLKQCPVKVTLQTEKMYRDLVAAAKNHSERIEPITVAALGNSQYIIDGHLRTRALGEARQNSIKAHIIPVKDISEVVRLHIELNTHGSINPLCMLDAVQFLKKHDAEKFISKEYLDLAEKPLHPKVRVQLDSFLADACKKYSAVTLPPHVIVWIVGYEKEKEQATATTVLLDTLRGKKEAKFVFPTPDDLAVTSQQIRLKGTKEKEVIIYEPKEEDKKGLPKVSKKEAESLIKGSTHDCIVHCPCGEKLLLDKKTQRVSSVKDNPENKCIKLEEEEDAIPLFVIPDSALDFLEVEPKGTLKIIKIGSKKELDRFASSLKDDAPLRILVVLAA